MEDGQAEYIHNVFRFGELQVSDVMVHRTEYGAGRMPEDDARDRNRRRRLADRRTTASALAERAGEHRRHAARQGPAARDQDGRRRRSKIDIMSIATAGRGSCPTSGRCSEQLKAFRRRKTHFALVVDEYGEVKGPRHARGYPGGDRRRHFRVEHDIVVPGVRPQPDGSVNVDGAVPIRDLNRAMDWEPAGRRGHHHRQAW